jgi:hypothetical protein
MEDQDILSRIRALVEEERKLVDEEGPGEQRQSRRQDLEEQLDQCWDLLRQRQARREFGQDPGEARTRSAQEVENYLQ